MSSLVNTLRANGIKFESAYLQENSTAEQIGAAKKTIDTADIIIMGLYGRVRTGAKNSVGLPENGAAILRNLIAAKRDIIGVSFGNPYILGAFPEMKTYLVAYGDMSSLQRAAATAIVGGQNTTGHLPISLPGLYPVGTGLSLGFAKALSLPRPAYPAKARALRIKGNVVIDVLVDQEGRVISAHLVNGNETLAAMSLAAARGSRFEVNQTVSSRTIRLIYKYKGVGEQMESCCQSYPYVVSIVQEASVF